MIRSVCTAFVNAPLFRKRGPDAQLLWFKLYMHPAQHLCGLFVLDLAGMTLACQLPPKRTNDALDELCVHGLCQVENSTDLVWLPEMSNQCKAMTKPGMKVHVAVDKWISSLGKSVLCHRVCDTLSIPYRYPIDTPLSGSDSVSGPVTESGSAEPKGSGVSRSAESAAPPLQLALVGDRAKSDKPAKAKKTKPVSEETEAGRQVWAAYEAAYKTRHGRQPKRNGWVHADVQKLIKNVGAEDAARIAGHYPTTNHAFYVKNAHAFRFVVTDYEKLLGEIETGRVVTETTARANERDASNPVFDLLRDRQRARAMRTDDGDWNAE